eukprot:9286631-Pyramimonas_sp.AAC.1
MVGMRAARRWRARRCWSWRGRRAPSETTRIAASAWERGARACNFSLKLSSSKAGATQLNRFTP